MAIRGELWEAAELIERYEKLKTRLSDRQRINLRFHAGQLYGSAANVHQGRVTIQAAAETFGMKFEAL